MKTDRASEIFDLIALLETLWFKNPELRLCQLVSNVTKQNDIFYVRDEYLKEKLETLISEDMAL